MNRLFRLILVTGGALLFAACGGGEAEQPEATDPSEATSASDTIKVAMTDFAYTPDTLTVPAGQNITLAFTNTGTVEHYFVVGDTIASDNDGFAQNLFSGVPIEKNKQTGEDEESEEHEEEEGGHENVFELPPGGSGSMTFTLPASKAGAYTIACFETTGGEKHHEMGMEGTLLVTTSDGN